MNIPNVEWLIENGGNIDIGHCDPLGFGGIAAVASDEYNMLAALVRRDSESLDELLQRLDSAIDAALNDQEYIDEING